MNKTLLLTPSYQPHRVINWMDAVKMKYENTADVVVEYDDTISSPSVTWKLPAVMRLKRLTKAHKRQVKFSRYNVFLRDGFQCQYCGRKDLPYHCLTYDHMTPRALGGKTTWDNIVTACQSCNSWKGAKTCEQAGMFPRKKPIKPKTLPFEPNIVDVENAPKEWMDYLPS